MLNLDLDFLGDGPRLRQRFRQSTRRKSLEKALLLVLDTKVMEGMVFEEEVPVPQDNLEPHLGILQQAPYLGTPFF